MKYYYVVKKTVIGRFESKSEARECADRKNAVLELTGGTGQMFVVEAHELDVQRGIPD